MPYTYRAGLTIDSVKYKARVAGEIEHLRQTHGRREAIVRLERALGQSGAGADDFQIQQWSSSDGQILHVNVWNVQDAAHALVYVNGLESHAGWFSGVARELAQRGIAVYALDRRGSGLNVRNTGTWRTWVDDLELVVQKVKAARPRAGVHVTSLCFGAAVATAFAMKHPHSADSLIYMSPGLHVKVDPTCCEKFRIALDMLPGLSCNIRSPIRADEMFTDSAEALRFLYEDKLRTFAPRARDFLQARRIKSYVLRHLPKVHMPSIVFLAEKDQIVDNAATRRTFMNFARPPQIVEYSGSEHIIFFGRSKERLISDIMEFVV
ncbi:MAG: alpha/beta fold hydrolase [Phycisphaerae bacterium]|nr:alpha/beta fold hydrolase [Phycisphaerae bacterium]